VTHSYLSIALACRGDGDGSLAAWRWLKAARSACRRAWRPMIAANLIISAWWNPMPP